VSLSWEANNEWHCNPHCLYGNTCVCVYVQVIKLLSMHKFTTCNFNQSAMAWWRCTCTTSSYVTPIH